MIARKLTSRIASTAGTVGLLIFGTLSTIAGIISAAEYAGYQEWYGLRILAMPMLIVGGLSLIAVKPPRRLGGSASYMVLLALMIQLFAMSSMPLIIAVPILFVQLAIAISLALRFPSLISTRILLTGCVLAGTSALVYPRTGPATAVHGNLCGEPPNHLCYRPVLGTGFPLQFVVDAPLISVPRSIGWEDNLRGPSLALNIFAYGMILSGSLWLAQIARPHSSAETESF